MNKEVAREYLQVPNGKLPSEIGEAVDVLYGDFGSYTAMASSLDVSPGYLGDRHHIFQLPKGIQWKVDRKEIGITQGCQIFRLKDEDSQWVLTLAIIEERLKIDECKNVVDMVLKQNSSIKDALCVSAGVRLDNINTLVLPLAFDSRMAICRGAWNQRQEWADYSYELILQGTQGIDVLQNICEDMKSSIEAINAQHQKIQAFLDHMSRIDDRADGQSDESNE